MDEASMIANGLWIGWLNLDSLRVGAQTVKRSVTRPAQS